MRSVSKITFGIKPGFSQLVDQNAHVLQVFMLLQLCLYQYLDQPGLLKDSGTVGDFSGSYWCSYLCAMESSLAFHYLPEDSPGLLETQKEFHLVVAAIGRI